MLREYLEGTGKSIYAAGLTASVGLVFLNMSKAKNNEYMPKTLNVIKFVIRFNAITVTHLGNLGECVEIYPYKKA